MRNEWGDEIYSDFTKEDGYGLTFNAVSFNGGVTHIDTTRPDNTLMRLSWDNDNKLELIKYNADLSVAKRKTFLSTSDFSGKGLWTGLKNTGEIVNVSGYYTLGIVTADANNSSSSRSLVCVPVLNNGSPYFVPVLSGGSWVRLRVSVSTAGMLSILESDGPYITAVYGFGN